MGFEIRGNYPTMTMVGPGGPLTISLSNGNLTTTSMTNGSHVAGTLGLTRGKWYWEATIEGSTDSSFVVGITSEESMVTYPFDITGVFSSDGGWQSQLTGSILNASTDLNPTSGDTLQFFLDLDAGKFWIGKNGTMTDSGNPLTGDSPHVTLSPQDGVSYLPLGRAGNGVTSGSITYNFGQREFKYVAPNEFKSINTSNFGYSSSEVRYRYGRHHLHW